MIRSKLSFAAYFWTLLPASFVTLGIVFLVHPQWRLKNKFGGTNSAIVPGIILVVLMGAILAFLLLQIVILIGYRDKLCLYSLRGKRRIERGEILSIDLWGRSRFNGKPSEMIRIELQGGEKIDFNGWSCRNLPQIKRALAAEYAGLQVAPPQNHVRQVASTDPMVFSGPVLASINGILFYGTVLFAVGLGWYSGFFILYVIPLFLLMLFVQGIQLYYFRFTADDLEIRNHVLPWYRKCYPLTGIANIELECANSNWSDTLCVRTYDYDSKVYGAGTLRKRHWQALAGKLRKRGIHVNTRNLGTKTSS